MAKTTTVPAIPKTGNPASVFSWLTKHFNAVKHKFQSDSNPWASYSYKTADIADADRKALIAHLEANADKWKMSETDYYICNELGVSLDLRKRSKGFEQFFSFSSPKKAKPSTIPYYD